MASVPTAPVIEVRPVCKPGQITFYWRPPTNAGSSAIIKYTLYCDATSYSQDIMGAQQYTYTVSGLTDGVDYTFYMTATNTQGESPAATFRTVQPGLVPFGPTVATLSTINDDTGLIEWGNNSTITGEGATKWYRIRAQPSSLSVSSFSLTANAYDRQAISYTMSAGEYYRFLVQAVNDTGYCEPYAFTNYVLFGPPPTPFSPSELTGLVTWLDGADAATVTQSSGTVTVWADKSGNGYNATHAAGSGPTYSSNGLNFTGQNMPTNTPFTSQITVIMVATPQSGGSTYYIRRNGAPADSPAFIANYDGSKLEYFNGGDRNTFATTPASIFSAAFSCHAGTQVKGWYNGSNVFTMSQTTENYAGSYPYILGAPGFDLTARFHEFIVYNRILTDGEMGQIMTYLAAKWTIV